MKTLIPFYRKAALLPLYATFIGTSLLLSPLNAVSAPDPASLEDAARKKEGSVFSAAALAMTELIEQEARPVKLSFKTIKDLPPDVSADGVTINGYSQYVTVEGQKVGQIIVTGLEKEGRTATLDPNSFNGQFALEENLLTTEKQIDVKGDRAALIEALRLLNEEPEEEEKEEAAKPSAAQEPKTANNAPQNDQANAYKSPERLEVPADPKLTVETTTEGCSVRVDYTQLVAIQQSKTVYYEDGARTKEDECSDSEIRYPLQKSYEVCSDAVDLPGMQATAQYTWFYVDQGQARQDISDCQPDAEKIFPITEKQSCSVDLDFENKQAIIQTALVYQNINGLESKVRDCEASLSIPPLPLAQNTDTCAMRHHFDAGYSEEMGTWTYEYEGVIYQATLCTNTEVTFTHEKIYKTAGGTDLCTVAVNLDSKTAVPMYRLQITVEGQSQFISECTPDETGALNIVATTEGCSDPNLWDHDIGAGISYAKERFYYENPNRLYVTDCIRSGATYTHSHEATGYQNHDEIKASYPLTTASINVNDMPFEVASSQVLPGATLIPYEYQTTREEIVGTTYTGCDALRNTAEVEEYKRPDGTDYSETVGPGTPIGPENTCNDEKTSIVWNKIAEFDPYLETTYTTNTTCSQYDQGGGISYYPCTKKVYVWYREATFEGERTRIREDGVSLIETASSVYTTVCKEKETFESGPLNPPLAECSQHYSLGSWNQAEGW